MLRQVENVILSCLQFPLRLFLLVSFFFYKEVKNLTADMEFRNKLTVTAQPRYIRRSGTNSGH